MVMPMPMMPMMQNNGGYGPIMHANHARSDGHRSTYAISNAAPARQPDSLYSAGRMGVSRYFWAFQPYSLFQAAIVAASIGLCPAREKSVARSRPL